MGVSEKMRNSVKDTYRENTSKALWHIRLICAHNLIDHWARVSDRDMRSFTMDIQLWNYLQNALHSS